MATDNIFAFVLMPFHEDYDDIYKMGIKETANTLDIKAERVDEQIFQEGILERIYRQIEAANIIVADMSDQNPNVFYEVGFAHAKEKLCILLTKDPADIPFDLKHHRHIVYGGSITRLRESLADELLWAKSQVENVRNSRIKVKASSIYGNLEKTKYSAKGEVCFKIDLHNDSNNSSSEIEAIYFYSTKRWSLKQDEKDCPHTESDIPDFDIRHFITPPIRKLHKNSWAQLRFTGSAHLGFAKDGEELKDKYRVTGRSILRLVTPEGNFDYEIPIDVECEEFPF
jgi:nucleoside 2-deoxyribosyltransferase